MKRETMLRLGCYGLGLLLVGGMLAACGGGQKAARPVVRVEPPAVQSPEVAQPSVVGPPALEARPALYPGPLAPSALFPQREQGEDGKPRFSYHPQETFSAPNLDLLLAEIAREVAGKVYYGLRERARDEKALTARVAVVAAVPLSDLKRESEFGRVLAEYLLTDLADRGLSVTELRLGRDIHILPQTGEFILSRNVGELANNLQELDYAVVSTYSNTRSTLMVYGRLVDLKNGEIQSSWRHTLPLNRELLGFFQEGEAPFAISVRGVL